MANSSRSIPKIHLQPLSVDFIDNHLTDQYSAFKNPQTRYDPALKRYTSTMQSSPMAALPPAGLAPSADPPRPAIDAMIFWSFIFPDAMENFTTSNTTEPEGRRQSGYSIRGETDWEGVYSQLQKARERYDGTKQGFRGRCKRAWRQVMDMSGTMRQVVKFVPKVDYVSPVLATLEVLLEAAEKASEVRDKVIKSFNSDEFEIMFGNIELFLATFPEDPHVKRASISLVGSTFAAIEEAIGFFLKHQVARGASVLGRGKDYQKPLVDKIEDMDTKSKRLIHLAQNSHISKVSSAMEKVLERTWFIAVVVGDVKVIRDGVEVLLEKMQEVVGSEVRMRNSIKEMLDDAEKEHQREREEARKERQEAKRDREEAKREREEHADQIQKLEGRVREQNELLRKLTPSPSRQQLLWNRQPLPLGWGPQQAWQPQQQMLMPGYPWPTYQQDPSLIQQVTQQTVGGYPALQYPPVIDQHTSIQELWDFNIQYLDGADTEYVLESREVIPARYRSRAEQVIHTQQFKGWISTAGSSELLIHGDFPPHETNYISGLSLVCATLLQGLRTRKRYVSLVFFCGIHIEKDDKYAGSVPMVKSLIFQLLQQCSVVASRGNLNQAKSEDIGELCQLFGSLVHCVPQDTTVIFLIDGVVHYETSRFEDDMLVVIRYVLRLARENVKSRPVKVLVMSPTPTEYVFKEFIDDDDDEDTRLLTMDGLPIVGEGYGINHGQLVYEIEDLDGED